jgi:integrase
MLPQKVHKKNGRYYYVHQNKWHKLTRVDEGEPVLTSALLKFHHKPVTYGQLFELYIAKGLGSLAPRTRPEYVRHLRNRLTPVFGHMLIDTLDEAMVAQYLQHRSDQKGPVAGNRERATLGSALTWGMRFKHCLLNPCIGVRRNKETSSTVYVADEKLQAAVDRAPAAMCNILAVAYLTGLRQTDLRNLRRHQVTKRGIEIVQSKDGKWRLITWTDALWHFVSRALEVPAYPNAEKRSEALKRVRSGESPRDVAATLNVHLSTVYNWINNPEAQSAAQKRRPQSDFVFCGESGRPFSEDGLQSAMKRLDPGFKFRELRPKAATDADHNVLGHNAQMLASYIRATRIAPVR